MGLALKRSRSGDGVSETEADESLEELGVLAESAGAEVLHKTLQSRDTPEAATLIGSGKVTELSEQAKAFRADLVLFDRDLTPTQLRNLEQALPCKVLDRTQLILDIFARRARTREGQLQVELAQLNYLLPRLTGRGVEMSRLGGGIGTRGPGETQLETDRRRIARRIGKIGHQLEAVRRHRSVQRRKRGAVPLATVALAGYTNAGKSTLFNALTGADVLADAKMFATLDPTVRQLRLPSRRKVLLSDTVGFIRNLPPTLVKAFRATLEEVSEAALVLHLVDCSSPRAVEQTAHVRQVLTEIGAAERPQVLVLTKLDLAPPNIEAEVLGRRILKEAEAEPKPLPVAAVSARTGAGISNLLHLIDELIPIDPIHHVYLRIPTRDASKLALIHEYGRVLWEHWDESGCDLEADVPESIRGRLRAFLVNSR